MNNEDSYGRKHISGEILGFSKESHRKALCRLSTKMRIENIELLTITQFLLGLNGNVCD